MSIKKDVPPVETTCSVSMILPAAVQDTQVLPHNFCLSVLFKNGKGLFPQTVASNVNPL